MRRLSMKAAVLVAAITALPNPVSAATYSWFLDAGASLTGTGLLTTGAPDNGGFDITSFTGTIGGQAVSLLGGDPGAGTISPSGAFIYDNILHVLDNPLFDNSGLLFSIAGREGNVWGNGTPDSYSYYTYNGSGYDYANNSASFSVTAVAGGAAAETPIVEPSTLLILAVGFLGIHQLTRRQRRAQALA